MTFLRLIINAETMVMSSKKRARAPSPEQLHYVRAFLESRFGHRPIELTRLKPRDILQFVSDHGEDDPTILLLLKH